MAAFRISKPLAAVAFLSLLAWQPSGAWSTQITNRQASAQVLPGHYLERAAPPDLHRQGLELYRQKNYSEAVRILEQAIASEPPGSPEYNDCLLTIGQSYFLLAQAPKAIPWLERLPAVNEANYMLGYAYFQAGEPRLSRAAFGRLFNLNPDSAAAFLLSGQMLMKKGYNDQAAPEIEKALELDPKIASGHFLLGEIAAFHGQVDLALADFEKELTVNPDYAMAWYRLGDLYTKKGQWALAIPDLQRAVWLNSDYSAPFILLGKCYLRTDNLPNAEGMLRKALVLDPGNASAHYLLGRTLIAAGHPDEGKAELEKVKAYEPAE